MKKKLMLLAVAVLACVILLSSYAYLYLNTNAQDDPQTQCYVGVAFCGNTTAEAELLIDRVKNYTNLFIIQSGPVSWNETATNEICDYAVAAGLDIVVYFGDLNPTVLKDNGTEWRLNWINSTRLRWGDHFLGVYYYDEPGGYWLDTNWTDFNRVPVENLTYDTVAKTYIAAMNREPGAVELKKSGAAAFVSDYALYWFDYLGGYDVVMAQAGWNHTYAQDIGLVRGAAALQQKDWGVIVTWKYNCTPYLDSGEAIYQQMVTAYETGAKYITIFNYPTLEGNCYGVMQKEHFEALERFWNDIQADRISHGSVKAEAVLVLPRNYGWGMRNAEDKIWGFWGADERSPQIWNLSRELLARYGFGLDIVYDDPAFPIGNRYHNVFYWNSTL